MSLFCKSTLLIIASLLCVSCASKFRPITLKSYYYNFPRLVEDSLRVSFVPQLQYYSNNKRYSFKEAKHGLTAVAVKIENLSSSTVLLDEKNFRVLNDTEEVPYFSADYYCDNVRQHVGTHMLHTLYGPWSYTHTEDTYHGSSSHFYFIPVGFIIGLGNAIRAGNANARNRETMQKNALWNKEIQPHQTLYGIVLIPFIPTPQMNFSYHKTL